MTDVQELQRVEDHAPLVIKFAQLARGRLMSDASAMYDGLFDQLPQGWMRGESDLIETRTDSLRYAHALTHPDLDVPIVAVEHETGVEFLVMGVSEPLAAQAAQTLVQGMWSRWMAQRDRTPYVPIESSLVFEGVREASADGHVRTVVRMVVSPPLSAEEIPQLMQRFRQEFR